MRSVKSRDVPHTEPEISNKVLAEKSMRLRSAKRKRSPATPEAPTTTMTEIKSKHAAQSPSSHAVSDETAHTNGDFRDGQMGKEELAADSFAKHLSAPADKAEYDDPRQNLLREEETSAWDAQAKKTASGAERTAAEIVWKIREHERENLFGNKPSEAIPGPETLDMGGQFLTNKPRIEEESRLFRIAQEMPKGAHLHLHFNSELPVRLLVEKAREMDDTMFIRSTRSLLRNPEDYAEAEMVFGVMPADTPEANLFAVDYSPDFKSPGNRPWMKWKRFQKEFSKKHGGDAEEWIIEKMVLSENDVYRTDQTTNGIWARFNQATRCFKGLMNYEAIFRWYIGAAVDSMLRDKVMYTELRPMLLDKSIPSDDGLRQLDHKAQMEIILEEIRKKQEELKRNGQLHKFPFGVKIIYCAPRSIPRAWMQRELKDCIKLKLEFPDLICGFDLVGAEDRPNSISYYRDELLAFMKTCDDLRIEIPFMFHAGETLLDTGGSRDPKNSNLYDAVILKAKRIGHGFSLVKHPQLIEKFKEQNICIELCPTSNELLHLCRNVKEHPYPQLLALGIPCTVNSDNPSLFRGTVRYSSSVSHEFYQVMVGSTTMSLHGWRQLAEWSITHSCLSSKQKEEARQIFAREWSEFCTWIVENYGAYADSLDIARC